MNDIKTIAIAAKDVIIPLTKASSGFSRQLFIDNRSFNLESFAISLRYATRLGLWQSWADTECIKYGIMQVGSLSIWQKWYATTSLARISIEFDIEVAEMWKKYVVTGHWYCYLIIIHMRFDILSSTLHLFLYGNSKLLLSRKTYLRLLMHEWMP